MTKRTRRAILVTFTILGSMLWPPVASASHQSCNTNATKVNNVHWGTISGQPSIKVVGQIRCEEQVDVLQARIVLWYCGQQEIGGNEPWLEANCTAYNNVRTWTPFPNDNTQTIRAPTNADAPVTATGWYVGDMLFEAFDVHGFQTESKVYGWYWSNEALCGPSVCTQF